MKNNKSKYTYVCGKCHKHKEECMPRTVKAFITHLTAKQSDQLKKELTGKRKELDQARKRLAEVDNLIAATFEKLVTGILTDEEFGQLNGRYLAEQETLKAQLPVLKRNLSNSRTNLTTWENFSPLLTGI